MTWLHYCSADATPKRTMLKIRWNGWQFLFWNEDFYSAEMKMPCPNAQGWLRAKFIWWQHNSSVTRSKFDRHKLAVKYYQIIQISPLTTWLSTRLIYVGALCFISNKFIKFKERILWKIFSRSIIVFFSLRKVAIVASGKSSNWSWVKSLD